MHRPRDMHSKRGGRDKPSPRQSRENGAEKAPGASPAALRRASRELMMKAEEKRFQRLARQWRSETKFVSNITTKAMHPAYQKIIGMGESAVRLILQELVERGPADWFWALQAIADANPVTPKIAGNMAAMTEAWIRWGRDEGYLRGSRRLTKGSSQD